MVRWAGCRSSIACFAREFLGVHRTGSGPPGHSGTGSCMPVSATSPSAASRSTSRMGSSVSPMLHRAHPILASLIYGLLRTRSGAATGSGSRSPAAPIPATDATTAPQSRSPPAHAYGPVTAQCSTMPSTPPQCGYLCTADLECCGRVCPLNSRSDLEGSPYLKPHLDRLHRITSTVSRHPCCSEC
jgi:hypothetical protein